MRLRSPRTAITFVVLAVLALAAWPSPVSGAPSDPSVRMFAPTDSATLYRYGRRVQLVDLPVWMAAVNGDFELRVSRPDYDTEPDIVQTGAPGRDFTPEMRNEWNGLASFFEITVTDSDGATVRQRSFTFCPNVWERQRIDDSGPELPRYPAFCSDWLSFFTKGMVWGIDAGWASQAFTWSDFGAPRMRLSAGEYTFHIAIASSYADLLEIPAGDSEVTLDVTVVNAEKEAGPPIDRAPARTGQRQVLAVPDDLDPDPATVPDLVALPLWNLQTTGGRERDFLAFAATPWNAGPAPLVVEGFRREGEALMDAYQYFRDADGNVVGRAPVGEFAWDKRRGHHHWHILQFATFTLSDGEDNEVVRSKKQSFCLAPTNAIDLTVERASWGTEPADLHTACGGETSLWIREVLQAGWADTYFQFRGGQSFNITNLPNGWYLARMDVNPLGALYETTTANNTESRLIYLGGRPGNRTVLASPWHGIEF
jgi:hypothetical protein